MYEKYYGFEKKPFNLTPDSSFFFASSKHEEAINRLSLAISERNGFALITGDVGSGKTTVCRALLNKLDHTTKVAMIFNTYMGKKELLTAVLDDLGVEYKSTSKPKLISAMYKYLLDQTSKDNNVVLIIDEAQNLTPSCLEEIRMLSNMETEREKLIQIILIGQPELRKKILNPKMEQFCQRIVLHYHLTPLDKRETEEYIAFRLEKAGCKDKALFTKGAIDAIYGYSRGIPRLINLACHNALITGIVRDTKTITEEIAFETIEDIVFNRFSMKDRIDKQFDEIPVSI